MQIQNQVSVDVSSFHSWVTAHDMIERNCVMGTWEIGNWNPVVIILCVSDLLQTVPNTHALACGCCSVNECLGPLFGTL